MGNSATRARTRRNAALAEALTDAVESVTGYICRHGEDRQLAASVVARLRSAGLHVADIGGQQVDDDTVHRAT